MKNNESPDRMKLTGVYCIRHIASGKVYVGSAAKSFASRLQNHIGHLRIGSHHSRHLQHSWSKYGDDAFEFKILRVTSPEDAVVFEQAFIDLHCAADRKRGFNGAPIAGSNLGVKRSDKACRENTERQKRIQSTPEARLANSIRSKKFHGTPEARKANSERGKKQFSTPEARKANSERATKIYGTPEARKAQSERSKVFNGTPEARLAASEKTKKQFSTPEARKAHSELAKARDADPVRKASRLAKNAATRLRNKLASASARLVQVAE